MILNKEILKKLLFKAHGLISEKTIDETVIKNNDFKNEFKTKQIIINKLKNSIYNEKIPQPDIQDVTILDDVFSAFQSEQSLFAHLLFRSEGHQIIVGYAFGPDEAPGKIRMNGTGRGQYTFAFLDAPCTHLIRSYREKTDKTQQFISGTAQSIPRGFLDAHIIHKELDVTLIV